jgi:hypothetical protein
LDAASQRTAPSLGLRDMLGAKLAVAENSDERDKHGDLCLKIAV